MDLDALSKVVELGASTGKKKLPRFDSTYEVQKVIGKGNFGVASVVRRKGHRTKYVAKEIRYYDGVDGKFTKAVADMAANEIRVLSRVSHPHLVKYIADFEESDRMIIIMDYAGKDLKQIIRRRQKSGQGPFDEERILSWLVQIILGLKYLHGSSMLHRDIKPGNIFVSSDLSRVKIGDFGLVKALKANGPQAHTICGTPQYFSPEMCQNDVYSTKADIWSLGCVLYELMTLEHPFAAPNKLQMYNAIVRASPRDPNPHMKFSEGLTSMVLALLNAAPDRRPSADDLLKFPVVESFVQGLSEASPPHSPIAAAASPVGSLARKMPASLPTIQSLGQPMKLPASTGGPALHLNVSTVSDDSDVDRGSPVSAAPPVSRKEVARQVEVMQGPAMDRNDLDEWITRTFEDSTKRRKIRSTMALATGTYTQGVVPLSDQCQYFDELMVEMGDHVTPAVHMTLMSIIFSRAS